ncbi:MAG: DNA polymerase Y family protein [Nevskiales bacterium]|nr:DNA polymerase Y family protein [Nevskiales bacterium]
MLWLCLYFPRLPAEAQGLRDRLDVVTEQRGPRRWLITDGPGIAAGTPLSDAQPRIPGLRAHPRRISAERAALKGLAHWIYRYGSPVVSQILDFDDTGRPPQALLWVEIGASERLFGGLDALYRQIAADLAELQQDHRLAIAPSRGGAALLAVHGIDPGPRTREALDAALAPLPSALLPWPQAQLDALHGVGLRRIGDLFELPRNALARRFGPERLRELDRIRARAPDPAPAITPPPLFRRRFELASEVDTAEALMFPLRRMTLELQAWLRSRDVGVRGVELHCTHARGQRTVLKLRFLSAHRDGTRIFTALRERLGREALHAPVRGLLLKAEDLATAAVGQGSLFDASSDHQLQWTETVERLLARLGQSALWSPAVHQDHRPERALARRPAGDDTAAATAPADDRQALAATPPDRPLWLLPQPVPLPAAPPVDGEPERIESGWWDGADARRDYYTVEWQQAQAWVFRNHVDRRWYLHGWWG